MSLGVVRFSRLLIASVVPLVMALLLWASPASAQVGVYGMFSAGHESGVGVGYGTAPNQSGGFTARGGTFGVYDNFIPLGPVKLGGDGRFFIQNSGGSTSYGNKLDGFIFGPRLAISLPAVPIKPYIQAEIGGVGTNNGTNPSRSTSFAYQINGGVDFAVLPHIDIRGEYGAGQLTSIGNNNHTLQEFGIGVVLRL